MHISQMKQSRFLSKGDLQQGPKLLTMLNVVQENIAMEGEKPDLAWCLNFSDFDKQLILKPTNIALIAQATGAEDTDLWAGKKIVVYHDPTISMGGKLVGGTRVRAPKNQAPAAPAPAAAAAVDSDEIPF